MYEWSPETQGIIFSSISYGIILTLIPSGYLAGIFGAKHMLGAGLLTSSLLTLFTPTAADLGVTLLVVIRVLQGVAQVLRRFLPSSGIPTSEFYCPSKVLVVFTFREWHGQGSLQFGPNGLPHWNGASSPASRGQVRPPAWVTILIRYALPVGAVLGDGSNSLSNLRWSRSRQQEEWVGTCRGPL